MAELRYRDDPADTAEALPLAEFRAGDTAGAVRIEPGDEARKLLAHLARLTRVDIAFPVFGDGRGYTSARTLREAGYTGELRAVGDVLVDQIAFMRRCGFDAFLPDAPLNPADVEKALSRWPHVYQHAADRRRPIPSLRHE